MEFFTQDYLEHHGVQGQKWGIRRFQNKDGSLTPAGKKRYTKLNNKIDKIYEKKTRRLAPDDVRRIEQHKLRDIRRAEIDRGLNYYENEVKNANLSAILTMAFVSTLGGLALGTVQNRRINQKYHSGIAERQALYDSTRGR